MPARFDDIEIGQVASLGATRIAPEAVAGFAADWPQSKRVGVDALRWMRNPPAGELIRGRMTIMGTDAVGEDKGIVIAQHDLLDEAGRLVFSCLTRSVYVR